MRVHMRSNGWQTQHNGTTNPATPTGHNQANQTTEDPDFANTRYQTSRSKQPKLILSVQLYAPLNLCASKIAAHVIHKMHHFATVCAGPLCARIAGHRRSKPVSNHALHQLYAQAKPYAQSVPYIGGRPCAFCQPLETEILVSRGSVEACWELN